jgi:threonyl-tRNA synthetase
MFMCESAEGEILAVKPMNCPGHIQIFNRPEELSRAAAAHGRVSPLPPLRELGRAARHHAGAPAFTQDDAHIFCTPKSRFGRNPASSSCCVAVYSDLGMQLADSKFSTCAPTSASGRTRPGQGRRHAEAAANAAGVQVERIAKGEGAFYGPKLEFHLKDAIGRTWQCGTLQLDYVLPERLDANYIGEDGSEASPVMLHRAICGSLERFIAVLIEHYAGALPLWLAPTQVVVATITSDADDYAQQVAAELTGEGPARQRSTFGTRRSTTRFASTVSRRCR